MPPADVCSASGLIADKDFYALSWQLFKFLVWPASDQRGKPVADDCIGSDFERRDSVQECFLSWFKKRQVRFVINHLHVGRRFFARLGPLEFDVVLVCNKVGGDENTAFR